MFIFEVSSSCMGTSKKEKCYKSAFVVVFTTILNLQ